MDTADAFTALSYSFTVETDSDETRFHVLRILGAFLVPPQSWATRSFPGEQDVERWRLGAGVDGHALWRGSEELYRGEESGAVLDQFLWALNQRVIRVARDFYLIRAAVLALPDDGAVLIPAQAGGGKSSLTVALVRAGFEYLSDELAPVDPVTGRVHPYSKAASLEPGSYDLFPDLLERAPAPLEGARHRYLTPSEMGGAAAAGPREVRAVVFCLYVGEGEPGTDHLTPGELAQALVVHSLGIEFYGARSLPILERLARAAPAQSMRHRNLDEAVATVRKALEQHDAG